MGEIILTPNPFTPTMAASLNTDMAAIHTLIDPIVVSLTTGQASGLAEVSTVRDSEIDDVFSGIQSIFSSTLPSGVTITDLEALNLEELNTRLAWATCLGVAAILENHLKVVKNNQMVYSRQSMDNARLLAKNNAAIASAVLVIANKYFTRKAKKPATAYTVSPAGKITVNGVKTGKMFTNTGTATLIF